ELVPDLAPRATLTLTTTPARISGTRTGTAVPALAFAAGRAAYDFDGERIDAELELPLARGDGGVDGRAGVALRAGEPLAASSVDAQLRAELGDLAFVSELVQGVDATAGSLSMDVAVSGTVGVPRIAGTVLLRDGTADRKSTRLNS